MWLLDVNLPKILLDFLRKNTIECDTTVARGWRALGNGILTEHAYNAGFNCILTRDKLFGESAARALLKFPDFSIVVIKIKQARESVYMDEFKKAWDKNPIRPLPGKILEWPCE